MNDFWNDPDRACAPSPFANLEEEAWHVDTFFPRKVSDGLAKQMCEGCPVVTKAACLQWALDHDELGVWGGTTEEGRRRLANGAVA